MEPRRSKHFLAHIPTIALLVVFAMSPWLGVLFFILRAIDRDAEKKEQENAEYSSDFRSQDTGAGQPARDTEPVYGHDVPTAEQQNAKKWHKTLTADAEKIRAIEEQIAALAPAEDAASSAAAQGTAFPKFEGSDLEGNPVDNSLFAGNAFTVVNFWFNGCKPCVEELDDLNALNEKVKAQGGEVVGINTETLDGNQQGIDAAKKLLETTGASYRNIYFASGSEAGKFALNIMAFPTTYVFDRDGNVVGQPLLGGIDKEENLAALQKNIDAALAKDSAK